MDKSRSEFPDTTFLQIYDPGTGSGTSLARKVREPGSRRKVALVPGSQGTRPILRDAAWRLLLRMRTPQALMLRRVRKHPSQSMCLSCVREFTSLLAHLSEHIEFEFCRFGHARRIPRRIKNHIDPHIPDTFDARNGLLDPARHLPSRPQTREIRRRLRAMAA